MSERLENRKNEVIQVGCISFQYADQPRSVEPNKLCLGICIEVKIHDHAFTTLQSLPPVNALSQHLNFPRQVGSDLGFRLRPFGFFLSHRNLGSIVAIGSARLESSLASGALRSWWIRLELSPVAPAILRTSLMG